MLVNKVYYSNHYALVAYYSEGITDSSHTSTSCSSSSTCNRKPNINNSAIEKGDRTVHTLYLCDNTKLCAFLRHNHNFSDASRLGVICDGMTPEDVSTSTKLREGKDVGHIYTNLT